MPFAHPFELARSRVVLVAVHRDHAASERVQRRDRSSGAERGHRELFPIGVGDQLRQHALNAPAHDERRVIDLDRP